MARRPGHLFHTTGTRDPRLRLVHPTRAKQDAHTGPRVTPDGLHLHVGGYRRRDGLSPPTRGAAYHPPAALMYILRDVLAESEHQEPNADVAWPEPLRPRPHAPTPLWLVTTDDQCTQATGQAQLRAEWVIVQVGAGQPEPRGLPRGTALLVATGVPHDPHMAVHALEDQPEDTGHLVVHQRGGPVWLKETRDGATVLGKHGCRSGDPAARPPGDQPRRHQGAERGPTDPQPPRRPVALCRPQRGVAQPHRILLDPGGLGTHLL